MSGRPALPWSPGARARVAVALVAAGSVSGVALTGRTVDPTGAPPLPWLLFTVLYAVAAACPVDVWLAGRARRVSTVAAPLAAGLLAAPPGDLLAARVLSGVVVVVLLRRRRRRRAFRNLLAAVTGTAAALVTLHLLVRVLPGLTPALGTVRAAVGAAAQSGTGRTAPGSAVGGLITAIPPVAVAALATATLLAVVAGLVVDAVARAWLTGPEGRRDRGQAAAGAGHRTERRLANVAATVGAATVGLAAAVAAPHGQGVVALGLAGSLLLLGQRGFTSLADRQGSLERLYELSGALADAPTRGDVAGLALRRACELLRAGYAEIILAESDPRSADPRPVSWSLRHGHGVYGPQDCTGMVAAVAAAGMPFPVTQPLGVRPGTPAAAAFLAARGVREALVVPLRVDGALRGQLTVADPLRDVGGFAVADLRLLETVANHASIALRNVRLLDRLSREARHDELTGLPNRLRFRELLDAAAGRAAAGEERCSVMLLDFDGFKSINDTLGHQAGDDLLRVLAARLADAAHRDAVVARLGGDEFAVLSTSRVTAAEAEDLARRLLGVFEEPVAVAGTRLRVGGSIGIALGPRQGRTGSDLMRNADIAMYAAKQSGSGARLYGDELIASSAHVLALASDLPDAIAADAVGIAVQPIVRLAGGTLHSVEVLARWRHPEHGEVAPADLFAAAERSGQVVALSLQILHRALRLSRRWQNAGTPLQVCVNLAPRWLADPELPDHVAAALAHHGVPPGVLSLEITERGVIADPSRAIGTLARLRDLGVHLAVDDFGTGYSSLTYLSRLPVDQVKIDTTFVRSLAANPRDQAIVSSIIHLGGSLGLEVVAEGIGDTETRAALLRMGCRLGQGYLFTRPLEPHQLEAFVAGRPALPGPRDPSGDQVGDIRTETV